MTTSSETLTKNPENPDVRPVATFVRQALFFIASIAISFLACTLAWQIVPRSLSGPIGTLGYPAFADFDIKRYYDAFYIITILFPLLAVLAYHLISFWSRSRRSFGRRARVFPISVQSVSTVADSGADRRNSFSFLWSIVRILLPAAVITIEVSITQSPNAHSITSSGIAIGFAYVAVVIAFSAGLVVLQRGTTRATRHRRILADDLPTSMSAANALLSLSVVPLLYGVSAATTIRVGNTSHVVHYPWIPLWLAIAATAALGWWTVIGLRRGQGRAGAGAIEMRTLIIVVACVAVFIFTGEFPGALGQFMGFDDSQFLAAPRLIFGHGLLPWSQILAYHGLLFDVLGGALGMTVFGDSRWGASAGQTLLLIPATWIGFYLLGAYFLRRCRILVAALVPAIALGVLGLGTDFRWLLYPYTFILLCQVLKCRSARWAVAFTIVVLIQTIVVPETDLIMVVLLLAVLALEVSTHRKGTPLRESFARTLWCVMTGGVFLLCFGGYLLGTRSLTAFIDYYRGILSVGSGLEGAVPIGRAGVLVTFGGQPSVRSTVELLLPAGLILITAWFVATKLRRRTSWDAAQWVMIPAAVGVLLYYQEALARLDGGHIHQVFLAALPLIILWIRQGTIFVEESVQKFGRRVPISAQWVRHFVPFIALGILVLVIVLAPISLGSLNNVPRHFHSSAPAPPPASFPSLGYTVPGTVDTTEIEDLRTVLNEYLKPDQPVFDFDNDVGVPYYLLNRVPGTRFDNELDGYSPYVQGLFIADLMKSKPRLVIFTNSTFGLPYVDQYEGTAISDMLHSYDVSQYLLDHYRPLVEVEGQLIMLRDDLVGRVPHLPHLHIPPVTSDLYFSMSSCAWGYSPNFLAIPSASLGHVSVRLRVSRDSSGPSQTVSGWAVNRATSTPATEIVAVREGRVIAETTPAISRPDIVTALRSPRALVSGFAFSAPSGPGPLDIFAVNPDGTASPIGGAGITAPASLPNSLTLSNGQAVKVVAGDDDANIDSVATMKNLLWTLRAPRGTDFSRFRWMTVTLRGGHGHETFAISNVVGDPTHEITWWALPQSGNRISVQVGSCLQWHGFGGTALIMAVGGGGSVSSVTLSN